MSGTVWSRAILIAMSCVLSIASCAPRSEVETTASDPLDRVGHAYIDNNGVRLHTVGVGQGPHSSYSSTASPTPGSPGNTR